MSNGLQNERREQPNMRGEVVKQPLDKNELESILDRILEVEFTFRQTAEPAQRLAAMDRATQDYVLDWVGRVTSNHIELGYQYACYADKALHLLDREMVEAWALHAMDVYDRDGLRPALAVMHGLDDFLEDQHQRVSGSVLEEVNGVLSGFLHGLSGRRLKLEEGPHPYTDTEVLYLPPVMARLAGKHDNFLLYKSAIALLWAQTRYGTFRVLLDGALDPETASDELVALFHALETLRLEAHIARELPGLFRQMERLKAELEQPALSAPWRELRRRVQSPCTTAHDCLCLAEAHLGRIQPFPDRFYRAALKPVAVADCMAARLEREKARFKVSLKELEDEQREKQDREAKASRFEARLKRDDPEREAMEMEILLDGRPMKLPQFTNKLLNSILLDLGNLPEDYLEPAGPGDYDAKLLKDEEPDPEDVWSGTYHEEGAHLTDEWDFRRQHYRKGWCAVRERTLIPKDESFVRETLRKHSGVVKQLRKTFEALRDEDRLLRRQPDGEGIDFDALVEAISDAARGHEMTDRLFTRLHRSERNIAVAFLVDMSGSTKGWINEAEREALVLLCEALESLGDRYAIYGFSSFTRKRCELFPIKRFDERYSAEVKGRIAAVEPQDYTRMGFAIRRMDAILREVDARTRVLVTLSDGKPDDYDNYRGEFGIEDTRRALIEARRNGIHPYCITIDEQARDYLPHLYGPAAYTVVSEVRALPFKVSDIYRRLTT